MLKRTSAPQPRHQRRSHNEDLLLQVKDNSLFLTTCATNSACRDLLNLFLYPARGKEPYKSLCVASSHKEPGTTLNQCYMDTGAGVGVRLGCGCPIR